MLRPQGACSPGLPPSGPGPCSSAPCRRGSMGRRLGSEVQRVLPQS
jgi:hypothetical protein